MNNLSITILLIISILAPSPSWSFDINSSEKATCSTRNRIYVSPGLILGSSVFNSDDKTKNGFIWGGELSIVYLNQNAIMIGLNFDIIKDSNNDLNRWSTGAIFGYNVAGLEIGFIQEHVGDTSFNGTYVRLFGTIGFLNLYARGGIMFDRRDFIEIGIILKIPLPVAHPNPGPDGPEFFKDSEYCNKLSRR